MIHLKSMGKICCKSSGQFGRLNIPNQIIKVFGVQFLIFKTLFFQKANRSNQSKEKDRGHAWLPSIVHHTTYATMLQLRSQKWTTLCGENPTCFMRQYSKAA